MHPLPGDFPRKSTYEIVEKIRCEGAQPLRRIRPDHPFLKTTFIGYDFDFNITEVNNAGTVAGDGRGKLVFTGKHAAGVSTVDVTAASERKREAQRVFRIVESLETLRAANCTEEREEANRLYPITGSIGMHEIVRTYVGLEKLTTLAKSDDDAPGAATGTPTVFSDVLTFTTEIGGGIKPTLVLNAVGVGSFRLTGASFFGDATRKDVHKLTVVLARDPAIADELEDVDLRFMDPRSNKVGRELRKQRADTKTRAEKVLRKEQEYLRAITGAQIMNQPPQPGNFIAPNNLIYSQYGVRTARTLEALQQKGQYAQTQVVLELERRKSKEEEERYLERLAEILKPAP